MRIKVLFQCLVSGEQWDSLKVISYVYTEQQGWILKTCSWIENSKNKMSYITQCYSHKFKMHAHKKIIHAFKRFNVKQIRIEMRLKADKNEWMSEWTNGWMDGWVMDGWVDDDGWMDGWMVRVLHEPMVQCNMSWGIDPTFVLEIQEKNYC
jgi:hypothetical protein